MWIFTEIGYFSVVQAEPAEDGTELVMIRARVRSDLEELCSCYFDPLTAASSWEILEWTGRDYPYRVIIPREEWAQVLALLALDIDYPNFKARIADLAGTARAGVYSAVWRALLGLERKLDVCPRNRSIYE